jgi:hypothetical protein
VRLLALFNRSRELELRRFCDRFEAVKQRKLLRAEGQAEQIAATCSASV